jgi:Transglycosylase SLT domain
MPNPWDSDPVLTPFDAALAHEGVSGKLADVARSIYQQESSGGTNTKTSNAGAVGGMQIIPATFASVADKGWDIADPLHNARAGIRYLKQLDKQSGGDAALTAAGYYGGPGGLEKARKGIAVSDPRNPKAPNTLEYSQQVAARIPDEGPVVRSLNAVAGAVMPSAQAAQGNPWDNDPVVTPAGKPAPSKDYEAGRQAPGALQGALSVINGPLMGFGDEAAGALGGAYDTLFKGGALADNYRGNRDFARGAQANQSQENPWTTGLTQAAASLPLGVLKLFGVAAPAAGVVAKAPGMLAQIGRTAATGAAYGGAAGAGNSTADTAAGMGRDAGMGALSGAALSAAVLPVARILGPGISNVAQRLNAGAADRAAEGKIAEALVRDARGSVVQSGASGAARQAGVRMGRLGDEAVIADAGGQNTKSLLDLIATLPGKTKEAAESLIHGRQAGRAGRMIAAADTALGTGGQRLAGTVEDLVAARQTASAPIYSQLHQQTIAPSPALSAIVQAADELGAVKLGRQMATAAQQPFTLNAAPVARNGLTNQGGQNWAMRDLDHVKQGLDQLISKQWDAVNGKLTPLGSKYELLRQRLLGELDTATKDPQTGVSLYKSARDAFAGPSAMIDAARAGQQSISKGEAAISQITASLSASERKAFQVGAFEALREKIGRSEGGRTEIIGMWRNPAIADKLKAVFGDERAFREFAATAAKEGRLKGLESVGRGSQTAARQYAAGDLDVPALADAGRAAASVATGNLPAALSSAANAWNRVKTPEATRDAMGRILMSGGAEGQARLAAMTDLIARINGQNAVSTNAIAAGTAKPAGSWFLD